MYAEGGVNKHAIVTYKNINKIFIIIVLIIYFLLNEVIFSHMAVSKDML